MVSRSYRVSPPLPESPSHAGATRLVTLSRETRCPLEKTTAVDREKRERVEAGARDAGADVDAFYEEAVFGGPPTVTGCRPPRLYRGRRRSPTRRRSRHRPRRTPGRARPAGLRLCCTVSGSGEIPRPGLPAAGASAANREGGVAAVPRERACPSVSCAVSLRTRPR